MSFANTVKKSRVKTYPKGAIKSADELLQYAGKTIYPASLYWQEPKPVIFTGRLGSDPNGLGLGRPYYWFEAKYVHDKYNFGAQKMSMRDSNVPLNTYNQNFLFTNEKDAVKYMTPPVDYKSLPKKYPRGAITSVSEIMANRGKNLYAVAPSFVCDGAYYVPADNLRVFNGKIDWDQSTNQYYFSYNTRTAANFRAGLNSYNVIPTDGYDGFLFTNPDDARAYAAAL